MPLYLKALDPTIDILGNEQTFRYNADQLNNEANLILQNLFTPLINTNLNTGLAFVNSSLNGFRFKHEFTTSSAVFGNFYLECASRFGGSSSNIFKYDEQTDSLIFLKNIALPTIVSNASIYSLTINNTNSSATATGLLVQNNGINSCAFGFNNSTNEAYIWAYDTASLNFGTANTKRMQLLNNGTLDLLSNNLITTGIINAQTGTLKGNNLSTHNAGSISILSSLAMNNNYINFLPTPINNQDAATKQFVLDNAGSALQSILHGFNNATYSTNVSVGDHIKFDGVAFVRGSNISLDTSSSYTAAPDVASVGRITLAAGKTYKLTGSINNVVSTNYNAMRWYNSDTNTALGVVSGMSSPVSTTDRVPSAGFIAYITTSVSTRVELRIIWNALSSVKGTGDGIGPTWFAVEEV